jgi:hypothetical protein
MFIAVFWIVSLALPRLDHYFQNSVLEIEDVEKISLTFSASGLKVRQPHWGWKWGWRPLHSVRIKESDKISCHLVSKPLEPLNYIFATAEIGNQRYYLLAPKPATFSSNVPTLDVIYLYLPQIAADGIDFPRMK